MSLVEELQVLFDEYVESYNPVDIDKCAELYTEGGAIYSPYGAAAIGRNAIRNMHRQWLDTAETNKKIVVLEAYRDGDLAYCICSYSGDYRRQDGSMAKESGTSLNIVRRKPGGLWRLHISSLSSDTPSLAV